ncbi:polysaccharide biosynthesis protein CapD [Treponema primitia ZAS-2]|uniref:Polysaccharide biosynthesis protein CapD n=1 Tax=Treponema primitia (strain ATCC BAA-887 / DSM 12427 / ZAS-2) TaxID=545694 RepID=F5YNZ8_TREPZ|nr:UDP-N-acetylglucosamine 4,6-dehydratase [Treponema primitia]AEF86024.1 polysaccharide biosynthesis protein CapD [Treponema primitia ZAS-2]
MNSMLSLIGRYEPLFVADINVYEKSLKDIISSSRFLVIGGAGSIGSALVQEIFKRNPKLLHVVDINENNMVELVRDIRSSLGYIDGEFSTFIIDCGSDIFDSFINNGPGYDFVFNLSALKHVRSEKDPYTLMRMIDINILNIDKTISQVKAKGAQKYFCVSTDKAANPVNMMGASKRIMEMFLMRHSLELPVSTARFANVAFSDGSLLYGFNRRIEKEQPISAPNDVRRYFVTPQESGELCLMSCLLGENRDIFFPKLDYSINLITFSEIAIRFLEGLGYEPIQCATEEEARKRVIELKKQRKYPVYFFKSDTTGEKDYEEFYTESETIDFDRFKSIGVIKNEALYDDQKMNIFIKNIHFWRNKCTWSRFELINLFNQMIPEFKHQESGKFLDGKM